MLSARTEVSLTGKARGINGGAVTLQLSWYPETRGNSSSRAIVPLELPADNAWHDFRVDAVAVGLVLKLSPPVQGATPVDLDNLRLIAWAPPSAPFSAEHDHFKVVGAGQVTLRQCLLLGAEEWFTPARPQAP